MTARVQSIAALLAICAVAQPAVGQRSEELQGRVEALTEQVRIRFGAYRPAYEPRLEAIRSVLSHWNDNVPDSGKASSANLARMDAWLDTALRAVMPGGSGVLPSAPRFERPIRAVALATPNATLVIEPTAKPAVSVLRPPPSAQPSARPEPDQSPVEPRPAARHPHALGQAPSRRQPTDRPSASRSPFIGPRLTQRARTAEGMPRSITPRRPVDVEASGPRVATIQPQDPFADDPAASPNPLRARSRRVARRPVVATEAASLIDLSQLTAQIRGYNAAMRELQAEVMRLGRSDLRGLSASADRLDRLEEKRRFLDLYRRGLPKALRDSLPGSPSAELIRELVRRRTLDLIRQTPPERRAERRALERLNDRLAQQGQTAANF